MFHLFIATPTKKVFDDDVIFVTVPGADGYFEVLQNHAPIISSLMIGKIVIRDKNQKTLTFAVSGGLIEVANNQAILLADTLERKKDIDIHRAEMALEKALKIIESPESNKDEIALAKQAYERARNRIHIAKETERSIFDSELM
jgi:F-type H+-transporting ATPase subunit epsilon